MEEKLAKEIVEEFKRMNGPYPTVSNVMSMTKIKSSSYDIYAIQKGDVTFLVWIREDGTFTAKTQCW